MKQDFSNNGAPVYRTEGFPLACYYVDDAFWYAWTKHRPFHWHPQVEIVYVLSGSITFMIGEESIPAQAGDILFVNSGIIHGPVERNGIYFSIVYDAEELIDSTDRVKELMKTLAHDDRQIISVFPREDTELRSNMQFLVERMLYGIPGHELSILSGLYGFYGRVFEKNYFNTAANNSLPAVKQLPRIKPVLAYIEENYMHPITLEDLAEAASLHPKYFSKLFKSVMNESPSAYLNEYRIRQSCDLLLNTNAPVIDVAMQCGFNDSSYFVSVFRKYKHVTPLQYRNSAYHIENS